MAEFIAVVALLMAAAAVALRHNAYINMLERAHRRKRTDQARKAERELSKRSRGGDYSHHYAR